MPRLSTILVILFVPALPAGCHGIEPPPAWHTDTDSETDTGWPVDCASIPASPVSITEMVGPRAWHDVAFDDDGHIVGSDQSSILKATYDGELGVLLPSVGEVEGMDYLPDGDLVVGNKTSGALSRVSPGGQVEVMVTDYSIYGVMVGPDGKIYVANGTQVYRVDPDDNEREILLDLGDASAWSTRAVNFSPALDRMYIASLGAGQVFAMDLDANMDPEGDPYVFASGVGISWQDAVGVDACGNLYVPEYFSNTLYRISPEGDVQPYISWEEGKYGHGLEWGSGIDGWRTDAIYLPQPYDGDTVVEVIIDVPSR